MAGASTDRPVRALMAAVYRVWASSLMTGRGGAVMVLLMAVLSLVHPGPRGQDRGHRLR